MYLNIYVYDVDLFELYKTYITQSILLLFCSFY